MRNAELQRICLKKYVNFTFEYTFHFPLIKGDKYPQALKTLKCRLEAHLVQRGMEWTVWSVQADC
jgi:hypothetical protein